MEKDEVPGVEVVVVVVPTGVEMDNALTALGVETGVTAGEGRPHVIFPKTPGGHQF